MDSKIKNKNSINDGTEILHFIPDKEMTSIRFSLLKNVQYRSIF